MSVRKFLQWLLEGIVLTALAIVAEHWVSPEAAVAVVVFGILGLIAFHNEEWLLVFTKRRPVISLLLLTAIPAIIGVGLWFFLFRAKPTGEVRSPVQPPANLDNKQQQFPVDQLADAIAKRIPKNVDRPRQKAAPPSLGFHEEIASISVTLGGDPENGSHGMTGASPKGFDFTRPFCPFRFDDYCPMEFSLNGDRLHYTVKVLNKIGQAPIEIKDGAFMVGPNLDANNTEDALEVVDENNKPIFQMVRKRAGQFVVNGIFPLPDGHFMVGWPGLAVDHAREIPSDYALVPMFKYPSWKHKGKFADGS